MGTGLVKVSRKFHQLGSQNPVRTDHSVEPVEVRVANKSKYVTILLQMKPAGKPTGPRTVEKNIAVRKLNDSSWLIKVFTWFLRYRYEFISPLRLLAAPVTLN